MGIVKIFTNKYSIRQALALISEYSFYGRPLLMLKYKENREDYYMEGTLDYIDETTRYYIVVFRLSLTNNFDRVPMDLITELCIYDERVVEIPPGRYNKDNY